MSEPSPYVLPTYAHVLNTTIANVIEQLNFGSPWTFHRCLRTLCRSIPKVTKKDIKEDLETFKEEMANSNRTVGVDLYWTRRHRSQRQENVIMSMGPPLFEKIIDSLDEHGFLLKGPLNPKHKTKDRFGMPK